MKPKQGDRIIIKNIPVNYPYKDCYRGLGTIDTNMMGEYSNKKVIFYTGYTPYKDDCFSISGAGHSANLENVKFIKNDVADFWKFKNGMQRANNAEIYQKKVNYWEIDFKNIQ